MPSVSDLLLKQQKKSGGIRRNFVAVVRTSQKKVKEKDLLFVGDSFTQLTNTYT